MEMIVWMFIIFIRLIMFFGFIGVVVFVISVNVKNNKRMKNLYKSNRNNKNNARNKNRDMSRDFKNHFFKMSKEERKKFLNGLNETERRKFKQYLYNNARENPQLEKNLFNDIVQMNTINEFNQWAMNESMKAVTPFDMGGYMMGDGFNPSDTMMADMDRQMQEMDNMNRQMEETNRMNDMNNFGGGFGF